MKKIILAVFGLLFTTGGFAASFDCTKVATAVEATICADPSLSKLDEEISVLYKAAKKSTNDMNALVASQREWIKERNSATTVEGLEVSHLGRKAQLQLLVKDAPVPMTRANVQPTRQESPELEDYELARLERMAIEDGKINMDEAVANPVLSVIKPVNPEYDDTKEGWVETFNEIERHDSLMIGDQQYSAAQYQPRGMNDFSMRCFKQLADMEINEFAKSAGNHGLTKQFNQYRQQMHTVRTNMFADNWIKTNGAMQVVSEGCNAMKTVAFMQFKPYN